MMTASLSPRRRVPGTVRPHRPPRRPPPRPLRVVALAAGLLASGLGAAPCAADLDAVFVLDTTGSMRAELREVQDRVRQLATALYRSREGERIRFGIVAYRDRGDDYVTRTSPLTTDVDLSREFLMSLEAQGGGDGPESVLAGVAAALGEMEWDRAADTDRQIFLIGDAPPHLDYSDEPTPEELIALARRERIVINTIGCRSLPARGVEVFRRLAYATEGVYQHIGRLRQPESGGVTAAMERTLTAAGEGPPGGDPVPLSWIRHREADATGILVRQGGPAGIAQGPEGDALAPCTLEVRLPPGIALAADPRVRRGPRGLAVELDLTRGDGGIDLFALAECPPLAAPVHTVLGGG